MNRPFSAVLQKRLNRSKCRLGGTEVGLRNNILDGVQIAPFKREFFLGGDSRPCPTTLWREQWRLRCGLELAQGSTY